jgi:hypothetical protein
LQFFIHIMGHFTMKRWRKMLHNMDEKLYNVWMLKRNDAIMEWKVATPPPSQGIFCTLSSSNLVGASKSPHPKEVATPPFFWSN